MTTTTQPNVLTPEELACLGECAQRRTIAGDARLLETLEAKGMLCRHGDGYALTPAAQHALHTGEPGMVPGIDN